MRAQLLAGGEISRWESRLGSSGLEKTSAGMGRSYHTLVLQSDLVVSTHLIVIEAGANDSLVVTAASTNVASFGR